MRLLKIVVEGSSLFEESRLELDFFAADRVSSPEPGEQLDEVHRLSDAARIYSQNVVGIAGVNASGKTTTLRALRLVLDLLWTSYHYRAGDPDRSPAPAKTSGRMDVSAVFWQAGSLYLLESGLDIVDQEPEEGGRWYKIVDETIWQATTRKWTKAMVADTQAFKENARAIVRRNGDPTTDPAVVPHAARKFLRKDVSIASVLADDDEQGVTFVPSGLLATDHATSVLHAFDQSVEHLLWDPERELFRIKYQGEPERLATADTVRSMLSGGTVMGVAIVERALEELSRGGFLVIDELEDGINKALIGVIVGLFQSASTNPHGAQLVFSTHYAEILDYLPRKDNVYVLVRDGVSHRTRAVKYSDAVRRIEYRKSDIILANVIRGSVPTYESVEGLRSHVREVVNAEG